jgi:hypothetical protein
VLAATTVGCAHAPEPAQCPPVAAASAAAPTPVNVTGAAAPPIYAGDVVARVNGHVITVRDVQERINKQSAFVRARYADHAHKKEFLDSLIRFEVLSDAAARLGYDHDPEVLRVMKQQMIAKFLQNEFEATMKVEDVPETDVRIYYDENRAEFGQRSLDEVRRQIRQRLFRERRTKALDKLVDDLRMQSRIDLLEENLDKIVIDTSGSTSSSPPAAPAPSGSLDLTDPR